MQMSSEERAARALGGSGTVADTPGGTANENDENLPPAGPPSPIFRKSSSLAANLSTSTADPTSAVVSTNPVAVVTPGSAFLTVDKQASLIEGEQCPEIDAEMNDGLAVPPVDCEWKSIHSYSSLYKPEVYSFMAALPSGRYGFMTPPVRPLSMAMHGALSPRATSSSMVSPTESSLNSLELEAIAAVHELQFVAKDIFVSELLPRTSELIFLNITTLEGQAYCIELTVKGWRVTSLRHDCMNGDYNNLDLHTRYFETVYALMDNISVDYRHKFSEALSAKLMKLAAGLNKQQISVPVPVPVPIPAPAPANSSDTLGTGDCTTTTTASAANNDCFDRNENVRFTIEDED